MTKHVWRAALLAVFGAAMLVSMNACSEQKAAEALEVQRGAVLAAQERLSAVSEAAAAVREQLDAIASESVSVAQAMGPTIERLPASVRVSVQRAASLSGGGLDSARAVLDALAEAEQTLTPRLEAALDRYDTLEGDLAKAKTDEDRFFSLLDAGIGVGITLLTGVPVAGVAVSRSRKRVATEVAGAVTRARMTPAGGGDVVDFSDTETRVEFDRALSEKTRRALNGAGLNIARATVRAGDPHPPVASHTGTLSHGERGEG